MSSSRISLEPAGLVQWRKKRGISLSAIATATKIGRYYLEAIESGEFGKLPGSIYSLSYVRQYARAIEYNEEELVECCRNATMPAPATAEVPPDRWTSRLLERMWNLAGS